MLRLEPQPAKTLFLLALAATLAAAFAIAWWSPLREAADIILFFPLIWCFMAFPVRGMVACGLVLMAARLALEAIYVLRNSGHVLWGKVLSDSVFPILLYVALGLAFHLYRTKQQRLLNRLVDLESHETMSQLARGLAHDFNNLLTAIMGSADLLRANKSLTPETRDDVEAILKAGGQAAHLISELANVAHRSEPHLEPADLRRVVADQAAMLRHLLPPRVDLRCPDNGAPLPVNADAAQLNRVITNLCKNASQAMPNGGTLVLRTFPLFEDGLPWAAFSVSDTGCGMDPETRARLFTPFFTTRVTAGGSGLGLLVVKTIIEDHAGQIRVESEKGRGSTFTILLPSV